jgi:hypothetical protein
VRVHWILKPWQLLSYPEKQIAERTIVNAWVPNMPSGLDSSGYIPHIQYGPLWYRLWYILSSKMVTSRSPYIVSLDACMGLRHAFWVNVRGWVLSFQKGLFSVVWRFSSEFQVDTLTNWVWGSSLGLITAYFAFDVWGWVLQCIACWKNANNTFSVTNSFNFFPARNLFKL